MDSQWNPVRELIPWVVAALVVMALAGFVIGLLVAVVVV